MSGYFETFGQEIRSDLTDFAKTASSGIATEISIVVYTCVLLYFLIKAFLIMSGRSEGAIPVLVVTCVKITLVAFFGLNAGNFASYVIPAIYGVEGMLLEAVSDASGAGGITNSWGIVDSTWETFIKGVNAIQTIWSKLSWGPFGDKLGVIFFILLMMVLIFVVSIYFMFFAVGYLLLYEIFLVMGLSFGPLFICTLMFPATRSWFDGWLRAILCWVFTLVSVAGMLLLIDGIFNANVNDLVQAATVASKGKNFAQLSLKLASFSVIVLAVATVVKSIPSFAAGLTGGVALQAASVVGLFGGINRTVAGMVGGAMLGYGAATHNDQIREKAANILGSGGISSNPGSMTTAAFGYTAGLPMRFFGANGAQASNPIPASAHMSQTREEEIRAQQNASAVGASSGTASGMSASGSVTGSTSSGAGNSGTSTVHSGATSSSGSFAKNGATGSTSAAGADFSADMSQFNGNSSFSSTPSAGSTSQSKPPSSQDLKEEAQAQANEKTVDEILKNRSQKEK